MVISKSTNDSSGSQSLKSKKKWATYAVAATAAAVGGVQSAEAQITHIVLNDTDHPLREVSAVGVESFFGFSVTGAEDEFNLSLGNAGNAVEFNFAANGAFAFGATPAVGDPADFAEGLIGFTVGGAGDPRTGELILSPEFETYRGGTGQILGNLSSGQDLAAGDLEVAAASSVDGAGVLQRRPQLLEEPFVDGHNFFNAPAFGSATIAQTPAALAAEIANGTNTSAFFGFRFDAGFGQQLGWGRISLDTSTGELDAYTVEEIAFSDPGVGLRVGQTAVPEPNALGILALGAMGVMTSRRRRREAASA